MSNYGKDSGGGRSSYDNSSGQKRNYSDYSGRGGGGSGNSGGYSRGNDDNGSGGYNRGRNDYQSDDRGGSGYSRGRGDHDNGGGGFGGGGSGGGDSSMETQRDTIFIQNLPRNVTTEELKEVFSQIGVIKNDRKTGLPKIWLYKDKATGEGKGEATITYEDEEAAQAAINWYNDKEVLANMVKISLATRRAFGGRGGHRGRGGGGGFRSR
ncbi:unnamed protein product, partial [Rotaria magnacalcarata]